MRSQATPMVMTVMAVRMNMGMAMNVTGCILSHAV